MYCDDLLQNCCCLDVGVVSALEEGVAIFGQGVTIPVVVFFSPSIQEYNANYYFFLCLFLDRKLIKYLKTVFNAYNSWSESVEFKGSKSPILWILHNLISSIRPIPPQPGLKEQPSLAIFV